MITVGKALGIARCSTRSGVFSVLALDHRNNLRRVLNPEDPEQVSYQQVVNLKAEIITSLVGESSAVLLDPQYGLSRSTLASLASAKSGLILAVEETGYESMPTERISRLLDGWSVEKIKRCGADAVKLLLYYHPQSSSAAAQEALVQAVSDQCVCCDIPLFLEILTHSVDPNNKKLSSSDKLNAMLTAVEKFNGMHVDLYKLEFPMNIKETQDESKWLSSCQKITAVVQAPWALLSAGVDFETFIKQTEIACRAGASGVIAGRAIWKEALELQGEQKKEFLTNIAPSRMHELAKICNQSAKPWTDYYQVPDLGEQWYLNYSGLD